jgi:hypothetical protein
MKKIIIMGADIPMGAQIAKSMQEMERGIIIVEKQNPFEPEPILITNPYKDYDEIINKKYYDKPKSKYHK